MSAYHGQVLYGMVQHGHHTIRSAANSQGYGKSDVMFAVFKIVDTQQALLIQHSALSCLW